MKLQSLSSMALALGLSHQGCFVISVTNLIFTRLRIAPHRLVLAYNVHKSYFSVKTTPLEEQEKTHTKSRGQRGAVREYCETCEVFGHDTSDCNDGETF